MKVDSKLSGMLILTGVLVGPVAADQVELGAAQDNTLYEDPAADLSNGAGTGLFVGVNGQGLRRRGLVAFDIAGNVPAGSTITGVTLTMHVSQTGAGPEMVDLHRLLADWGEGTSVAGGGGGGGAPATAGDATWRHTFFDTDLWGTEGGDFVIAASGGQLVGGVGFYDFSSADMAADVQSWLDDGSGDFGWLLLGNETMSGTTKRFDTRESLDPLVRPMLVIDFVPVPAPGAGIALAALLLGSRRRRS